MIDQQVAEKYAQALFELAQEEASLEDILAEFTELIDLVQNNQELRQMLQHPELSGQQKKEVLAELFASELSTTLFNFINLLVDKKRANLLVTIYQQFKKLADEEANRLAVEVKSPIELSANQLEKLRTKLESELDKEIELEVTVKPDLIGGLVLQIGDKVIDGSLLTQLENINQDLNRLEVSQLGVRE